MRGGRGGRTGRGGRGEGRGGRGEGRVGRGEGRGGREGRGASEGRGGLEVRGGGRLEVRVGGGREGRGGRGGRARGQSSSSTSKPVNDTSVTVGSAEVISGPATVLPLGLTDVPSSSPTVTTTSTTTSARISQQPPPILINVSSVNPLIPISNSSAINVASRTRLEPSTTSNNTSVTNPTVTSTVHHQSFDGISTTTQPSPPAHTTNHQPVLHSAEVQSELLLSTSINPSEFQSDNNLPVIDDANTIILSQQMCEEPQQPPLINPQEVVGSSSQIPTPPQLSFLV